MSPALVPVAPDHPDAIPAQPLQRSSLRQRLGKVLGVVKHHFEHHVGAGLVASVAYFDPGNWSVDLEAGALYGYRLLFVVLLAGLGAALLQSMALKLGVVTRKDIAQHCRQLLYNHPKHPKLVRYFGLYPLFALSELAIIATDLAELLGSAIGLVLLIPSLPLYAAVLVTAADVFIILLISDPGASKKPVRMFEALIVILVIIVFASFLALIIRLSPDWGQVFLGFVPSNAIVKNKALYTSIGILGATVMPHALFLGSSLATLDRVSIQAPRKLPEFNEQQAPRKSPVMRYLRSILSIVRVEDAEDEPVEISLRFVLAHLRHGIVDMVLSLLGCAVTINASILIVAGHLFFFAVPPEQRGKTDASLFDAFDILEQYLGRWAAILFAIALLCAGQSAAITATLSGQIVSEGFIAWRTSPFLTRTFTRMLALIPATIVAAVIGKQGINALLVASQVILSLILPFVVFPLVWLTSNEKIMTVEDSDSKEGKMVSFKNSLPLAILGYTVFAVVVVANVAALVTLAIG